MKECKYCKLRKAMAIVFDCHWFNEYDCPMQCPYNVVKGKEDAER